MWRRWRRRASSVNSINVKPSTAARHGNEAAKAERRRLVCGGEKMKWRGGGGGGRHLREREGGVAKWRCRRRRSASFACIRLFEA